MSLLIQYIQEPKELKFYACLVQVFSIFNLTIIVVIKILVRRKRLLRIVEFNGNLNNKKYYPKKHFLKFIYIFDRLKSRGMLSFYHNTIILVITEGLNAG